MTLDTPRFCDRAFQIHMLSHFCNRTTQMPNNPRICNFRAPHRHILGTQIDTLSTLFAFYTPLGSAIGRFGFICLANSATVPHKCQTDLESAISKPISAHSGHPHRHHFHPLLLLLLRFAYSVPAADLRNWMPEKSGHKQPQN